MELQTAMGNELEASDMKEANGKEANDRTARRAVKRAESRTVYEGRRYGADQVVCLECEHVREMRGETDEVIRRTRSEGAENAVLNAVREGGVEPDWFVERWVQRSSDKGDGVLVACAVFEDAGKCAGFRKAVNDWVNRLERRNGDSPIRLRSDSALEAAVAEHFTAEWARMREEQMGKFGEVLADARKSGKWNGRVVVGEYAAKDEGAKAAFEDLRAALEAGCEKDEFGDGGLAYSGYWDKADGGGGGYVARFAFGFPDEGAMMAAQDRFDGIGARFYDPIAEDGVEGVELEMAALVIARMQTEENERKAREEVGKDVVDAVCAGVAEGIAAGAEKAME